MGKVKWCIVGRSVVLGIKMWKHFSYRNVTHVVLYVVAIMMIVNSNDVIGLGLTMSNIYMWPVCNFHSYHIEATTNYVVKTTGILIPCEMQDEAGLTQ